MSTHSHEEDREDYAVCDDEDDGLDNEDTIAEDELHELEEDNDLEALQAEAEMDIEELRKRYYGAITDAAAEDAGSSHAAADKEGETSEDEEVVQSELVKFMTTTTEELPGYGSDDDAEYSPKFYKPPRVGAEYQHMLIPNIDPLHKKVHDHADLLWKPSEKLNDQQLDKYQESVLEFSQPMDADKLPANPSIIPVVPRTDRPIPFWDSEEALYILMQNNYDPVKAKKAFADSPPDVNLPRKTHFGISLPWTEEDLEKFETGLHVYLKQFNKIQKEYLPGRSLGEIIHFYYRWKKTERMDMWREVHIDAFTHVQELPVNENSTDIMSEIIDAVERDNVPAAEANVLVAAAQQATAKLQGRSPP